MQLVQAEAIDRKTVLYLHQIYTIHSEYYVNSYRDNLQIERKFNKKIGLIFRQDKKCFDHRE